VSTLGALDAQIFAIGKRLYGAFPKRSRNPMRALDDKAMELASRDAELRAALFRLVDVTPATRSLDDLARHLSEYLEDVDERPPSLDVAMKMAGSAPGRTALGAAAAAGVKHMAHRFIVGSSPKDAVPVLRNLWRDGIASSVDLLGEATVTQPEADRYAARCAEAVDVLARESERWPDRLQLERDSAGSLPRANLSVKVSALTPLLRPDAPDIGREDAAGRLRPLLRQARDLRAHLHVDMESLDSMEATLDLVFGLLGDEEFAGGPSTGIVLQAYLRESPQMLDRILAWAESTPGRRPLVVRLVKGAYWDHEVIEARQHGWAAPVFEDKAACDRNFEELTRRLLDARPFVRVAIASHNLRSVAHAIAYDQSIGGAPGDVEFQVLRGLGDDLAKALASFDLRVRAYCPVGDLVAGMAYLVRRLLENTSNESFLAEQASGVPLEELLAAP
jgi:RHH-type proline utilization regulon transcriptional repressor/proline dehydrogenase/delta 1-pyrroline-5-carboxylate dehydrogenase